jgi:hypothetical protein
MTAAGGTADNFSCGKTTKISKYIHAKPTGNLSPVSNTFTMAATPLKRSTRRLQKKPKILVLVFFQITAVGLLYGYFYPSSVLPTNTSSKNAANIPLQLADNKQSAVTALAEGLPSDAKVYKLNENLISSPNTVVTGYFLAKSKFPSAKYDEWMSNMLSIQDAVVIFTQPELVEQIKRHRQHALNRTVIVALELKQLPVARIQSDNKSASVTFWQNQLDIDVEKRRHKSYQLFWIWLSKTWWVRTAIALNYFNSAFYMYTDIGCFRNKLYNGRLIVQHPEVVPGGSILWMAHRTPNPPSPTIWNAKLGRELTHFYHSGSQGAGRSDAWVAYHAQFAKTLDAFLAHDMFVGEDQCVLQSACLKAPHLCAYAPYDQVPDNKYFGLRHVLSHGASVNLKLWRPPAGNG